MLRQKRREGKCGGEGTLVAVVVVLVVIEDEKVSRRNHGDEKTRRIMQMWRRSRK
jgi:hypothetical protein